MMICVENEFGNKEKSSFHFPSFPILITNDKKEKGICSVISKVLTTLTSPDE